jgi:hypothetical protein
MAAGALVGGAGAYLIVRARDDQKKADAAYAEVEATLSDGRKCDTSTGLSYAQEAACKADIARVNQMQDDAKVKKWVGWGVAGVGGAALVTGIVLRLIADDPEDFRVAGRSSLAPYAWTAPTGGGFGVSGRF